MILKIVVAAIAAIFVAAGSSFATWWIVSEKAFCEGYEEGKYAGYEEYRRNLPIRATFPATMERADIVRLNRRQTAPATVAEIIVKHQMLLEIADYIQDNKLYKLDTELTQDGTQKTWDMTLLVVSPEDKS